MVSNMQILIGYYDVNAVVLVVSFTGFSMCSGRLNVTMMLHSSTK